MSRFLTRRNPAVSLAALLIAASAFISACAKDQSTPTQPTPPTTRPNVTIAATLVLGESRATGYAYRVIVNLKESAGVAATITGVDLTFVNGSTVIASSHFDKPISDGANVVPASGTMSTRELTTVDADATHPFATSVQARVTFTDGTAFVSTASATADVPPLSPSAPQTYTLTGVITDASTHAGIGGARLDVLAGANAGKTTTTDGTGAYSLRDLIADSFRLRASATGYSTGEQGVTVPAIPRADFELRKLDAPCGYSVAPTGFLDAASAGSQGSMTITRASGTCGWQASADADWITLGARSGSDSANLSFTYRANTSFAGRVGTITVEWSGGSAQLIIRQAGESPAFCLVVVTVNGQSPLNIPASATPATGSQRFTASVDPVAGVPPGICGAWNVTGTSGITFPFATSGPNVPATITFDVQDNASTSIRTMFLTVNFLAGTPSGSLTVNQSGK
jgi:carboxypeptidase family protein/all-beta uncharacterized protein